MATSGTSVFVQTKLTIVTDALSKVAGSGSGIVVFTTDQLTAAGRALNSMVASWQARDVFLWKQTQLTQVLTVGTQDYNISTEYLELTDFYLRRITTGVNYTDYPVRIISREDFTTEPLKAQVTGIANRVYIEYKLDSETIHLLPVADQADTLYYTGIERLQDFTSDGDNPDFPVWWSNALIYGLASNLSYDYGCPLQERQDLAAKAEREFLQASGMNQEKGNIYISPRRRR